MAAANDASEELTTERSAVPREEATKRGSQSVEGKVSYCFAHYSLLSLVVKTLPQVLSQNGANEMYTHTFAVPLALLAFVHVCHADHACCARTTLCAPVR